MNRRERRAALDHRAPRAWRYMAPALGATLLVIVAVIGWNREFHRAELARRQIAQSYTRRLDQISLLSSLKDAETAQRGYLLTGSKAFLEPFDPARRTITHHLAQMRAAHDPDVPAAYVKQVDALMTAKLAELDRTIALERAGRHAEAVDGVRQGIGKQLMDDLRGTIGAMIDSEAKRMADRRAAYVQQRFVLRVIVLTVSTAVILVVFGFLIMLWRLQKARYQALVDAFEAAERNATILDSTIDAILIINPSGTIEVMNAAAMDMLGYSSDELGRRDIGTIIDIAPGEGSFHKRVGLIGGQLRRSFFPDRTVKHRDGREIAVDVAIGVMSVPSGEHLVASLRDISERKRIERVKDDLISTVSHELRTPLTSVVGSLGLLRAGTVGPLPDEAAQLVEIAENNSRRLIRLINDMLDIDRIESGKLHVARDPIDLRIVVDEACMGSEGLARASQVTLTCAKPDKPVMVSGDADRLLQVVTNILSNAIRAAPAGSGVELGISIDADQRALVTIDDRGPGIPPGFRERIFGRFERAAREDGSTGTGLGLAISREIVARHDGTIWFEDREGGGTRFAFALPQIGLATARDATATRVLVCEQDKAIAANLIATVINEGCAYDLVDSVAEARVAMGERAYAALLVDLNLPEEGGLAFVRTLRDGDTPFAGAVIVVSSDADYDGAGIAPLDVVDWIDKPGDADRIATALRSAVHRTGRRRPVVLHLDDDRDLLNVVSRALAPEIDIVTATDLASARAILQHASPDAVILDIQLAEGSGLELMPFLVDSEGLAIPTIIYSAQEVSSDLIPHVDAVLVKARGSIPDLKATIRRVVRGRDALEGTK
jgi:PAS domain S-box-containing protein